MAKTIIEVEMKEHTYLVTKHESGTYFVFVDGVDKHGTCAAEDVMRALGWYMHDDSVTIPVLKELSKI